MSTKMGAVPLNPFYFEQMHSVVSNKIIIFIIIIITTEIIESLNLCGENKFISSYKFICKMAILHRTYRSHFIQHSFRHDRITFQQGYKESSCFVSLIQVLVQLSHADIRSRFLQPAASQSITAETIRHSCDENHR